MRPSIVYGVTLTVLMIGSYLTWTSEDAAVEAAEVIVVDAKAEDIQRIVYTSEKLDLDLEAKKDDRGTYLWVQSEERRTRRVKPQDDGHGHGDEHAIDEKDELVDPDGEAAEGEEPEELEEPEEPKEETQIINKSFKAGDAGDKLLETFAPLEASRLLDVAEDSLEDFGLKEPSETLAIHRVGKDARTFDVGGEAYGTKDRYLRDTSSGKVYLVSADALNPLKRGTTSLPDRDLMSAEVSEVLQVQVNSETGSLTLEQRNRDDKDASHWRTIGEEEPNESAGSWLEKVFRLRSSSYVAIDEMPTSETPAFAVTITTEDQSTETLQIFKAVDPDGKDAWYGRSEHTRELVKVHTSPASQAAEDLSTILE